MIYLVAILNQAFDRRRIESRECFDGNAGKIRIGENITISRWLCVWSDDCFRDAYLHELRQILKLNR